MKTKTLCVMVAVGLGLGLSSLAAQTALAADKPAKADKSAEKLPAKAVDNPLKLADDAPTSYTVVKGDTLWGISAKFLNEPFRWPEIWNMNRDQVKDPHWIYPGDVIQLAFDSNGKPMLLINGKGASTGASTSGPTERIGPRLRTEALETAISSIPASAIVPFLSSPMIVAEGALATAPKIVGTEEGRVIVATGDKAYVAGIAQAQGLRWQLYRPGKPIRHPKTNEVLGHEAIFLGDARVTQFGDANTTSTIEVVKAAREVNRGDRLTPTSDASLPRYSPRAPEKQLSGQVASILNGVSASGQHAVVVLTLGARDGLEVGHVLASSLKGETISTRTLNTSAADAGKGSGWRGWLPGSGSADGLPREMRTPDERNGLLFVFRVFDRVSYALVMSSARPLGVGDSVATP